MKKAHVHGIELEYEVKGSGEPLLLISNGPIADTFHPFVSDRALLERHRMIAYHQRGQAGSGRRAGPEAVSFEQHAADAAGLLQHLGVPRAHVVGHSTGAIIALQLAVDQPGLVHSLVLLEPPLMSVPSAGAFVEKVGPAVAAYRSGDREDAMAKFLGMVSGLDWPTCRTVIQQHVPGGVAQAIKDADTMFGSYLVALEQWKFGAPQAATLIQPMLSVVGTATEQLFVDSNALLRAWFPRIDECTVDGLGHLLHIQRPDPVLSGVGAWLARHPMRAAVDSACRVD